MMLFIIGLPVMQIILFCLSIGKDPLGLGIAVVNRELNNSAMPCIVPKGCEYSMSSCRYLHHLEKRKVKYLPYDTDEEAKNAIARGWAWAALSFPQNFSESLSNRVEYQKDADEYSVIFSEINIYMDNSSKHKHDNFFYNKIQ